MLTRHVVLACAVLIAAFASIQGDAQQPPVPGLLAEAPVTLPPAAVARLADIAERRDTRQSRAATVNLAALESNRVDIAVAPGRSVRALLASRVLNPDGSESWSGQIEGEPFSAATFVRSGALLQGSMRTLTSAYSVEPLGPAGLHVVREVDLSAMGDELPSPIPDLPGGDVPGGDALTGDPPMADDDGTVFDVLVVYTAAARTAAGGDAAIQARINLGITETNTAYANSGIIPRLRLVSAESIAYTESTDLGTDLSALTSTTDGLMDAVHARRNAVGADLVKLVVGSTAGNACGVAWLMTSLSSAFAANAFSVTAYPCISPNYTFGHELGHNMGSHHAPEDDGAGASLYPYSYGYKHPSNVFRTVMAYNCPNGGCPRVLHFSNPGAQYNGSPTGTAAHNNALSINNARATIANWRQAVAPNTAPTITPVTNRTTLEDTATPAIAFTVADAQTAAGGLAVTASSSNATVVANTSAALALGGSGGARTIVVTPQPNASGTTVITLAVSDGTLNATTTFELSVSSVNDAPTISAISPQTTLEDQSLAVPFTVADIETSAGSLTVQATSSNTALLNSAGIGLGGSGGSRIVTLAPVPDMTGTTTITLTVSDGALTSERAFALTVSGLNDAPAFVMLPPLVSTTTAVPTVMGVTIGDAETAGASLSLSAVSSNTVLLPPGGIAITPVSATASTRTFQVTLTPAVSQAGSSTLIFTASDGTAQTSSPVAFNVTTASAAPHAPTAFLATADGTNVTFSWVPALTGSAPTGFSLEIGTSAGTTTLPTQAVAWPTTTRTLALPEGTYFARVRAVNTIGSSPPSPEASVVVTESNPIPGPPGNFWARIVGRTVSFTWTASASGQPATNYTIEAGSAPGLGDLASISTFAAATSFEVANVPPGTYWVRVRGSNAAGTGAPSQDVAIVMGASSGCVGLAGAPVLLTPVVDGTNVSLTWNQPTVGGLITGYVLMAGSTPGGSDLAYFNTGSGATSFAASAPAGLYYVRVAAVTACGVGAPSNEVSFSMGASLPGVPRDLAATVAAGGLVSLTWAAPASGATPLAYLIEAGSATGGADLAVLSTGSPGTAFSAIAEPGTYYVRVRAISGAGPGLPSGEVVVTVP